MNIVRDLGRYIDSMEEGKTFKGDDDPMRSTDTMMLTQYSQMMPRGAFSAARQSDMGPILTALNKPPQQPPQPKP